MSPSLFLNRRLLLITGKGGVGKTVFTAALARAFAQQGKRVLCGEIVAHPDTPSQLREALGGPPPTEEPTLLRENIFGVLLTPTMGHLRFLQDALPIRVLADAAMKSQGLKKFLSAAPGFSDMGVMYRMLDLLKRDNGRGQPLYDVCLVDSPATGHALALAQIPEFLTRVLPGGPIFRAAQEGLRVLTDPAVTATVIVTLPEALPVTEALELERGLMRYRLPVSAIVVNRVPHDPFSTDERSQLREAIAAEQGLVYGARELQRIERAEVALKGLAAQRTQGVLTLPEVDFSSSASASTELGRLLAAQA